MRQCQEKVEPVLFCRNVSFPRDASERTQTSFSAMFNLFRDSEVFGAIMATGEDV